MLKTVIVSGQNVIFTWNNTLFTTYGVDAVIIGFQLTNNNIVHGN